MNTDCQDAKIKRERARFSLVKLTQLVLSLPKQLKSVINRKGGNTVLNILCFRWCAADVTFSMCLNTIYKLQ